MEKHASKPPPVLGAGLGIMGALAREYKVNRAVSRVAPLSMRLPDVRTNRNADEN